MNKYILLKDSFRGRTLEKKVFSYCMSRQLSLIRFLPMYIVFDILYFFGIFSRKKYCERRWSFLSSVKGLSVILHDFFIENGKKFYLPADEVCVISDAPAQVMSAFALIHASEAVGNDYDMETGKFTDYRKASDLIPEGEEYEAFGTALSPIMKKAAHKTYLYGKSRFKTKTGCIVVATVHYFFAYALMLAASVAVGFLSLWWAAAAFEDSQMLYDSYFEVSVLPWLNIIPVVVLTLLLYFLFDNPAIAVFVSSFATMLFTWVNYYKLLIRNDPFLVQDFGLVMEAGDMSGKFEIVLENEIIATVAVILSVSLIIALLFRCKTKSIRLRAAIFATLAIASWITVNKIYLSNEIYSKDADNPAITNMWSETEKFRFRGFVYPFINSIKNFSPVPDGYSKHEAASILAEYTDDDIPEDKRVNVIAVMLEAFADFSRFDSVEFVRDPYEKFHNICDESFSGSIVPDIFIGGTVRTERTFITGSSNMFPCRTLTNSYAWYFGKQGYTVEGSHPGYDWYYNRVNINKNLGYSDYYFDDDTYMDLNNGERAADNDILFPNILKLMNDATDRGEDYFSFNITYQGHGPYVTYAALFDEEYVSHDNYTDYAYYGLNNYLYQIESVSQTISDMIDELRDDDKPVVVIMFGDHMPWMGDNNSIYEELNINLDISTDEGFCNYYMTPYFIWANDTAKGVLGNDFKGDGPTIGSYFLMNEFFKLAGYGGNQYSKFTADIEKDFHVIHSTGVCFDAEGNICRDLTPEQAEIVSRYQKVQYYYMTNFKK